MVICLLGSTGYLGRRIKNLLVKEGHKVVCTYRDSDKITNDDNKNVIYIKNDFDKLKLFFESNVIDCFVNACCSYMKVNSINKIVESNLVFPLGVLSLAMDINSRLDKKMKFINIDTGLPDDFNLYTFSKGTFTSIGKFFVKNYNIQFINILLENFYGENEPEDRFLPSLILKLVNNATIPLTQGEQHRDFIYIEDVVNAICLIIQKDNLPDYLDIPLGSGEAPSIKDLVIYLKNILNSKSILEFGKIPLRPNEPSSKADLSVLHMLGGSIKYNWENGLQKMLINEGFL